MFSILLSVLPVKAQEGFPLDPFQPTMGAGDLLACRSLKLTRGRLSLGLSGGWSWHLAGQPDGPAGDWLAEQNLGGGLGLELDVSRRLRLGFSAYGAAWQNGSRIDAWGHRRPLSAGWGESWLWALVELARAERWRLGAEVGVRFPSASEEALSGEPAWGSRQGLLWEMQLPPLRFLLNINLVGRRNTVYYRWRRSSALQSAAGVELAPPAWPAGAALEAWSENALDAGELKDPHLQLLGSGFFRLGRWRMGVGLGWGLLGAGTARFRLLFRLGTTLDFSHSLSE